MTPYECLEMFTALKLHFSTSQYDYFKYNGKLKNPPNFQKRRDKHFFSWLANKPDPTGLMLANFIKNPNIFVGDLFNPEANDIYLEYIHRLESLGYIFKEQMENLRFPHDFKVIDHQHPGLLQHYLQNKVDIETMVILNDLLGYIKNWDKNLKNDPIWLAVKQTIIKYKPFLHYSKEKYSKIVLDKCLTKV